MVHDGRHLRLAQYVPKRRHACEWIDLVRRGYPFAQPFGVPGGPDSGEVRRRRCPLTVNHVTRGAVSPEHQGGLTLLGADGRRLDPDPLFPIVGHVGLRLARPKTTGRGRPQAGRDHLRVAGM